MGAGRISRGGGGGGGGGGGKMGRHGGVGATRAGGALEVMLAGSMGGRPARRGSWWGVCVVGFRRWSWTTRSWSCRSW